MIPRAECLLDPAGTHSLPQPYALPPLYRTTLTDASVFASGVVLAPGGWLLKDVSTDLGSPADWHRLCELRRLPPPVSLPGELTVVAVLGGGFYHWVFDALPRLAFLEEPSTGAILIENTCAFHREYLTMAGVAPEQVLCPTAWSHYQPERLIVPSLPGVSGEPPPESVAFLRALRDRALAGELVSGIPNRRLYVTRAGRGRSVRNEREVRALLTDKGFEIIDPGALSVREQMRAFSAAQVVVGAHGGALTNLAYCRPGTSVIEFFPASYVNPCFRRLCWLAGLVYGCLVCPVGWRSRLRAAPTADYAVPLVALDRLLARATRRLGANSGTYG